MYNQKGMSLLNHPYFYQLSIYMAIGLKKLRSIVARELNSTSTKRTLDVCCGTGNFADLINGEYTGFDLNSGYIPYAKKRF
jgi:ubiquinone/menaquinone biosynthesis C-methylase UbiE